VCGFDSHPSTALFLRWLSSGSDYPSRLLTSMMKELANRFQNLIPVRTDKGIGDFLGERVWLSGKRSASREGPHHPNGDCRV